MLLWRWLIQDRRRHDEGHHDEQRHRKCSPSRQFAFILSYLHNPDTLAHNGLRTHQSNRLVVDTTPHITIDPTYQTVTRTLSYRTRQGYAHHVGHRHHTTQGYTWTYVLCRIHLMYISYPLHHWHYQHHTTCCIALSLVNLVNSRPDSSCSHSIVICSWYIDVVALIYVPYVLILPGPARSTVCLTLIPTL